VDAREKATAGGTGNSKYIMWSIISCAEILMMIINSMGSDYVSELQPSTGPLFIPR
jgi:hypothetical protein